MTTTMEDLKQLTNNLIQNSNYVEHLYRSLVNLKGSINWLNQELETVNATKGRKTKSAHIDNLRYQLRSKELEYSFKKHEWDSLSSSHKFHYRNMESSIILS